VYDIWLTECKGDGPLIKEAPETAEAPLDDPDAAPAASADAPAATPSPKPTKTRRARSKPSAADAMEPPADVGRPPRSLDGDQGSPGAPLRIGR
jgi:hypothetical protein